MCITARPQRLLVRGHGKITLELGSLPLLIETIGSLSTCITFLGMLNMHYLHPYLCTKHILNSRFMIDPLSSKQMLSNFKVSFSAQNNSRHSKLKLNHLSYEFNAKGYTRVRGKRANQN